MFSTKPLFWALWTLWFIFETFYGASINNWQMALFSGTASLICLATMGILFKINLLRKELLEQMQLLAKAQLINFNATKRAK